MEKKRKKELTFILIFFICVTLSLAYLFQASYAKYKKQISGNVKFSIAEWNIKLNNENINGKNVLENAISPTYYKNDFVEENVIAPGSTGYVDLKIDASAVDVTFNYSLTTSIPEESAIKDLKITHYQYDPDIATNEKIVYDNNTPLTGTIVHNTESTVIRLYIIWNDSEENIMDNKADTEAASNSENHGIIKATFNFTQAK
ncbi:MAG: hypothetical protein Q4F33_05230 [Mycoplasmatota bacterium]|nr:hypothetical protein [Mycoplasmatota bacterium]